MVANNWKLVSVRYLSTLLVIVIFAGPEVEAAMFLFLTNGL